MIGSNYASEKNRFSRAPFLMRNSRPTLTAGGSLFWSVRQGLEAVWDGDSLDWKEIPADEITQRVVSRVCPGSIVLFHNAAIHTPEALPGIIQSLLQEGYTFVPISQIILPGTCGTDYTIDHTGRQQPCQS